jgi:hypothetical protein
VPKGKPIPPVKEPSPEEAYAEFGYAVTQEMMDGPVFFRLIMGKLGARVIGPV